MNKKLVDCRIGQGAKCCKYIVMSVNGFQCMKISPENKKVIDDAWAKDEHVSQGDNCEGKGDLNG
tara:strand:+ start:1747 stop:1941 length:195 start_codon:yes stop_codon:yes gene_type:complete